MVTCMHVCCDQSVGYILRQQQNKPSNKGIHPRKGTRMTKNNNRKNKKGSRTAPFLSLSLSRKTKTELQKKKKGEGALLGAGHGWAGMHSRKRKGRKSVLFPRYPLLVLSPPFVFLSHPITLSLAIFFFVWLFFLLSLSIAVYLFFFSFLHFFFSDSAQSPLSPCSSIAEESKKKKTSKKTENYFKVKERES